MSLRFEELKESDLSFVKEIYDYYTLNTTVVYFINPVTIEQLKTFIPVADPIYHSYILKTPEGEQVGFCYFSRFRPREAFRISVELTVYLKPEYAGKGYGSKVITHLEHIIKESGFTNIMALVTGENKASIHMFEKQGYQRCAHIKQVAEKFGKRLDLLMFQKLL